MMVVTVDRSSLGLEPLVFGDPASGRWVAESGLGRPGIRQRRTYAGDSRWLDGDILIAVTREQSSTTLPLYVKADTRTALYGLMDELEEAFSQFTYTITISEHGNAKTWAADPADVEWGEYDSGMSDGLIASATVVVPLFPRSA